MFSRFPFERRMKPSLDNLPTHTTIGFRKAFRVSFPGWATSFLHLDEKLLVLLVRIHGTRIHNTCASGTRTAPKAFNIGLLITWFE